MQTEYSEKLSTMPRPVAKSIRPNEIRCKTSCYAGKTVPHAYIPMLREERLASSRIKVKIDMDETVEPLMNPIAVTTRAVFVPFLAFERFEGSLDRFNRSDRGVPDKEGGDVVPFIHPIPFNKDTEFNRTMGFHEVPGANINSAVIEAYNTWVNYRRKQMSEKLPLRDPYDQTLANCEWRNTAFRHIVADFDQAAIDGEVPLNVVEANMPIAGITRFGFPGPATTGALLTNSPDRIDVSNSGGGSGLSFDISDDGTTSLSAELQANGITLSLSNIEMAKKTAWMAAQRKRFTGHDDDHIIDLFMDGVRVPDAQLAQPIVLDKKTTLIGFNRRFATDSENLEKSVTTGETMVRLTMRTPPMNTGGIVIIVSEIVPEQLFERQRDHFLSTTDKALWPSATRDELDPEKVDVIQNRDVDVLHSDPDGDFGFSYLNSRWKRMLANIGGRYYRTLGDPFDENRQQIWAVETTDPELTSDFYLANNLHHKVFADETTEPFDITTLGSARIIGDVVFGKRLEENTDDYNIISEQVDTDRVDQDA